MITPKMKAKGNQKWLEGARTTSLRVLSFLNEGGEVFGYKNVPLLRFYILSAGVARPGELVHILTILLPQTTHTHLKYFINIQIFVVSFIFIYIYAHWRANLTSRTHLHLKRNFHAFYLHLRSNSTSYIHLGSILVPFLAWVHFF